MTVSVLKSGTISLEVSGTGEWSAGAILQYGSWGYKASWKRYRTSGNGCGAVEIGHGTTTLPTNEVGWKWWVTSS
ncbi:hypothetical protein ACFWD7_09115 [Streptomyces mirabilis]|uniref:hypothetical protein n=1 Tax=Streptomyces mirabilis TaxID=68239 RepID=UPI0021C04CC1|nr:hypothetical protein [Streptomyces mirabilis]MCT9106128.1 hypothetical protein [Streptomyces mirabilis]